jgi:Tol biopolymer transport system component
MQQLTRSFRPILFLITLLAANAAQSQLMLTEGTNITVDVSRADGRIATDLLGSIWIIPHNGGDARRATGDIATAKNPRWSPDGLQILYQGVTPRGSGMRLLDVESGTSEVLGKSFYFDQQAAWHPSGERIVFSSEREDSGLDLWELDLASRLQWRLTNLPGDETEAAWSANGRHLAYIHRSAGHWTLMLRRFGDLDPQAHRGAGPETRRHDRPHEACADGQDHIHARAPEGTPA